MNHLLFFIISAGGLIIILIGGTLIWWMRRRGHRFQRTKEDLETEKVLDKAFGKNMKWGYPGSAQDDVDSYRSHTDSGGDSGGADSSD